MKRLYFIFGDLLANILTGGVTALVVLPIISNSWHMFAAMIVGMMAGMVISIISGALIFIPLFGAMEVMVPTMLSGMFSGMVVGMWATMSSIAPEIALLIGSVFGVASLIFTYSVNRMLIGKKIFN